ncbi:Transmembrane protein 234 [Tetrabaena socialis]|uniref:Transmembrane protein 234 n=1 Tax=Tetrabaena socialis TaxID=47790 RepID=A0A2J8A5L9_9CHLO|nr:Transmembrane protein 234 [Tetrabaena socialis]|eukprot:PNH07826.1 Transmembrane protein 234 [Tetrabaena socialis]
MQGALAALVVGLLWGVTNPFVKRGSEAVSAKLSKLPSSGLPQQLRVWLSTPAFLIPQLLNQSGSALFIYLLGSNDISVVVPAANAGSLVVNALADLALGEPLRVPHLLLGAALVAAGVYLCGTPA